VTRTFFSTLFVSLLWATTARADEPHQLKHTGYGFLGLESLGTVGLFAAYSIATDPLPKTCSWCKPTGFDESLRSALRSGSPKTPALISHGLSLGVIPLGSFAALLVPALRADHGSYALQDGWIILNSMLLTTGLADGTKKLAARQRPAFYHGVQGETEAGTEKGKNEENLSFFSGDTAWAFTAASSAATLAFLRGYKTAPYIAAGGGALALTAGLLRISADMHWGTDVLTGAAVGTAVGVGLPLLLHGRAPSGGEVQVSPTTGGSTTGVSFGGAF